MTSHDFGAQADPRLRSRSSRAAVGLQGAQSFRQVQDPPRHPYVPMTSAYPHGHAPITPPPLFRGIPPPLPVGAMPPPPNFHGPIRSQGFNGSYQYGVRDATPPRLPTPPISPQPHPHLWRPHPFPIPLSPMHAPPPPWHPHLMAAPFPPRMVGIDHSRMGVAYFHPPPGVPAPSPSRSGLVSGASVSEHHTLVDPFVGKWLEELSTRQRADESGSIRHRKVSINRNLQRKLHSFAYVRTCFSVLQLKLLGELI